MQRLVVVLAAAAALSAGANRLQAEAVEIQGPHICCKQCVKIAEALLAKIDGVSDAKASIKDKTITFTAKNAAAAKAGINAIINGGFYGSCKCDGKEVSVEVAKADGKADVVAVEHVHVCCGLCEKAINALFKSAKVSYEGTGPQRTVRIEGAGLDRGAVLNTLRKAGFNGAVSK